MLWYIEIYNRGDLSSSLGAHIFFYRVQVSDASFFVYELLKKGCLRSQVSHVKVQEA